jgi:hypothetical protein
MVVDMEQTLGVAEHRSRIATARDSVAAIGGVLWQVCSGGGEQGLAGLLGEVDALGAACDAARVAVTAEAMRCAPGEGPTPLRLTRR